MEKLGKIREAIERKKGQEIVILDFQGKNSLCDYAVIATGLSNRNIRAISEEIEEELMNLGERRIGIEGKDEAHWVLIDGDDVIVHILTQEARELYKLEELWGEAEVVFPKLNG